LTSIGANSPPYRWRLLALGFGAGGVSVLGGDAVKDGLWLWEEATESLPA
jgi:hypothetical protein